MIPTNQLSSEMDIDLQVLEVDSALDENGETQTNSAFTIINTLTCSIGSISALFLILYSYWRPKYFNKAVGRLLLSLAVTDILYALARILPFEGDELLKIFCIFQGTFLLAAAVSGGLVLTALSLVVFRIVVYHTLTEIKWWLIAFIFITPVTILAPFMFFAPSAYRDDDQDGLCSLSHLTISQSLNIVQIVSVSISTMSYAICLYWVLKEKKNLKVQRLELIIYRNMTMRLCFAYSLAALLSIIPEWTIKYNAYADDPKLLRMIIKGLFGGGRGLIHSLCFTLVFHGDVLVDLIKRLALQVVIISGMSGANRITIHRAESSTYFIDDLAVETLDYQVDDLERKTLDLGLDSFMISIPSPAATKEHKRKGPF